MLTVSDTEEHIFNKVMAVLTDDTVSVIPYESSHLVLTFPDLEIRINEQVVYHNNRLVPLTHHEFFTLLYLAEQEILSGGIFMAKREVGFIVTDYCGKTSDFQMGRWFSGNNEHGSEESLSKCVGIFCSKP